MAKKRAAKPRLVPEAKLEPLRAEAERLADERDFTISSLARLPYYHAVVYYMMFSHFLEDMRARLGGIDDDAALANAFFWYSVVFEYAHQIEVGSIPLAPSRRWTASKGPPPCTSPKRTTSPSSRRRNSTSRRGRCPGPIKPRPERPGSGKLSGRTGFAPDTDRGVG